MIELGTTSAYAENTYRSQLWQRGPRNYLRVRGEYRVIRHNRRQWWELPPRTRRILGVLDARFKSRGTTSAYAENTFLAVTISWNDANYLRVRGEYILSGIAYSVEEELPPRTRRIPRNAAMTSSHAGTTSAYAENTSYHSA